MRKIGALLLLAACGGAQPAPAPRAPDCDGDRVVSGDAGLAALSGCRRFDGSLILRGAAALDLTALAELEEVSGDLTIGPTFALERIRFDKLRRVGGALRIVSNGLATSAVLPSLEHAGSIEVAANLELRHLAAPVLRDVDGDLVVTDNLALELVNLAADRRVGGTFTLDPHAILTESKVRR